MSAKVASRGRQDVRPPNDPWKSLEVEAPPKGCLSYYLSDDLSRLPVRHITRVADNKSDPNLETGTYGLFSTCQRQMRGSIVKRGLRYIFFLTRHGDQRVIAGYYDVCWYCEGVFASEKRDYAVAAHDMHFIDPPLRVDRLPKTLPAKRARGVRAYLILTEQETGTLLRLLQKQPDRTRSYLDEIDRLEHFNQFHTGYRCWNRTEPFTWAAARSYLLPNDPSAIPTTASPRNSSPTGHWICETCEELIRNKALLKMCPGCEAMGSLRPATEDEMQEQLAT